MIAYERLMDRLRDHGSTVTETRQHSFKAQCPSHQDNTPSLNATGIDGRVLVHCFGGCETGDILTALNLKMADLFDDPRGRTYAYPGGRIVRRTPEKKFWQDGVKTDRTLYGADTIDDNETVYVTEGEQDVDAIRAAGGNAVCPPMGAGKAHMVDWDVLYGRDVRIVADRDAPGRDQAHKVLRQLIGMARSVTIVEAAVGKDAADHIAAGLPLDAFEPASAPDAELEPEPLTGKIHIPPFPVDAYPDPIADMVNAVSEATQTDPAMAALSALSALSACTGGHAQIEVRPGWREPLCVYTVTVASPGERKSAVQQSMTRPLLEVEAQLAVAGASSALEAETRKQVAVKTAERERTIAASVEKGKQDKALADAIGAAVAAKAIVVPPIPRLVADDVTPEAAASLIAEQNGRLAIISAEGGIFDHIAGRYSKLPNMDLWLKGHAGDPVKVDRKGRPPEYIRSPALTIGLMIQPSVLAAIAANREFRGRGLLARFLYAMPVSKVGRRTIAPSPVDPLIEKAYETSLSDLASGLIQRSGELAILQLSELAHEAMTAIEAAVEPTLAGTGELAPLADWGAKYVGAVARIAGILHLAEHGADKGPQTAITAVTIRAASRIGMYLKAAAINAFVEMGIDEGTADAVYLLERIQRLGADEVSERDMQRACKSRFPSREAMLPALNRLKEHGYLTPVPVAPTGGRPASLRYRLRVVGTKKPKGTEDVR